MQTKNFLYSKGQQAVSYATPSTETYYMSVQGILCGSYDTPDVDYDPDNNLGEI